VTNSYLNVLCHNKGDGTFEDATAAAGLQRLKSGTEPFMLGGVVAGDFDDDGWPDLYLGFYQERNRLFLNDGNGRFEELATDAFRSVDGAGAGASIGDTDGDGDLDILQANFSSEAVLWRNLGGGRSWETAQTWPLADYYGAGLADVDNDGDLDINLLGLQHFLFLNDGTGAFATQSDQVGIAGLGISLAFADYDGDGFVDVWSGGGQDFVRPGQPYRNQGNDNHWLQVELVGTQSNRRGIGARLIAEVGNGRQRRDILGGTGASQSETVAQFGLGEYGSVERLEIRWPSGLVDVLTDVPADQRIRVFEGKAGAHSVEASTWRNNIPDAAKVGASFQVTATVRPGLFEEGAQITRAAADLSALGGPENAPLVDRGDGTYQLESRAVQIIGPPGVRTVSVLIDQASSLGPQWTRLSKGIEVLPPDLPILDDDLSTGWQMENSGGAEAPVFGSEGPVLQGDRAAALQVKPSSFLGWSLTFVPREPVDPFGYLLRFAFHPGSAVGPRGPQLNVFVNTSKPVKLIGGQVEGADVNLELPVWQMVEIPLDAFELAFTSKTDGIESVRIGGNLEGTFHIDDLGLFTHAPPVPSPPTVVLEERAARAPQAFELAQNYPNPFNSDTVMRFALPTGTDVELTVTNLAGQRVATLVRGVREAGTYTVRWDGQGDDGRELASGVYLYRLRTGGRQQVETRKLLLLR